MDEGAAFGFFPQLRPRRRLQDPTASADVPFQVLRGRLAGLLGLPSDIGNIVRSPQPMEAFGSYDYEQPKQLPYTTEQFLKELPLAPTAPIGQLAGQAASFVPLNPAPLIRGVQKLGTMVGEGMAERVATGRPMLPSLLAEPQAAMFAVEPNVPRMNLLDTPPETMTSLLEVKPQAPVSDLGFYSAAEQAALNLQRNKGSGQAFLNDLLKAENVKKDELQWMGVDDFLKEKPNVTKQEVQDFIANNRVDVQEVQLGNLHDMAVQKEQKAAGNLVDLINAQEGASIRLAGTQGKVFSDEALYALQDGTLVPSQFPPEFQSAAKNYLNAYDTTKETSNTYTKYQKYTLPGGENYREILLTMPEAMPNTALEIQQFTKRMETMRELQNEFANAGYMEKAISFASKADDLQAYIKQLEKIPVTRQTENFESSHFDQPNILAHMRVNDRVDADGKKMLLVEEIQSDWHQAGREKGYKTGNERAPAQVERELTATTQKRSRLLEEAAALPDSEMTKFKAMNEEIKKLSDQATKLNEEWTNLLNKPEGVPDAPFKDTWYQLALKRLTKYAADNGYERIGLTTGRQQADRFNLAESFDAMNYKKNKDGTYAIAVKPKGEGIFQSDFGGTTLSNIPEKELPSIVGKELAQKIISGEGRQAASRKVLEGIDLQVGGEGMKKYYDEIYPKFLDKYGKKYGASVGETQITTGYARDADGIPAQRPSKETIRYLDVTPQMKEGTSKGQPLFAATPLLPATSLLDEEKRKEITSLLE